MDMAQVCDIVSTVVSTVINRVVDHLVCDAPTQWEVPLNEELTVYLELN
jgi:hypothetical protein